MSTYVFILGAKEILTHPHSFRLRVDEAVDMLAVDLDQDPPDFDEERRMWQSEYVLELCGSLVRVDINREGRNCLGEVAEVQTITAAHATVIDFLRTRPVKIGSTPEVRLTRSAVNLRMAEMCLTYLRYFVDHNIVLTEETIVDYPFANLCAELWHDFYREAIGSPQEKEDTSRLKTQALALLSSSEATLKWIQICRSDSDTARVNFGLKMSDVKPGLYYAAKLGLTDIVDFLIKEGHAINQVVSGGCGTPFAAACGYGRRDVVCRLLEEGANPMLCGNSWWGCPLAAALTFNHLDIVKILLAMNDVNVNCRRVPSQAEREASIYSGDHDYIESRSTESMVYIAADNASLEALDAFSKPELTPIS